MVPFFCEVGFACSSVKTIDLDGNISLKDVYLVDGKKKTLRILINQWYQLFDQEFE